MHRRRITRSPGLRSTSSTAGCRFTGTTRGRCRGSSPIYLTGCRRSTSTPPARPSATSTSSTTARRRSASVASKGPGWNGFAHRWSAKGLPARTCSRAARSVTASFRRRGPTRSAWSRSGPEPGETGSYVRNVTAVATGEDSAGIQSRYNDGGPGSHTLTLTNSIAQGASDLRTEDSGGPGRIAVSNSNFDLVKEETPGAVTGGGNQTAAPLFVGPRRLPRGAGLADDRRRVPGGDRPAGPCRQPQDPRPGTRHRSVRVRPGRRAGAGAHLAEPVAKGLSPAQGRRRGRQQAQCQRPWNRCALRADRRRQCQLHR